MQKLPALDGAEFIVIENGQSPTIKREAATRFPGQYSVIILSGSDAAKKQNTARYIAHQSSMPVYRIRLSLIVSADSTATAIKLRSIFETAKNKNWVLFFDEADALFGKRTDVQDGHDRYDNESIDYFNGLVQAYRGSIILSVSNAVLIHPCMYEKYVRFHIH